MKELTDSRWIQFKGVLFLVAGLLSGGLLLHEHWEMKTAILLALSIWCFCRFYYFAFYVIERYVDPRYRFTGLWSFAKHCLTHRRR